MNDFTIIRDINKDLLERLLTEEYLSNSTKIIKDYHVEVIKKSIEKLLFGGKNINGFK